MTFWEALAWVTGTCGLSAVVIVITLAVCFVISERNSDKSYNDRMSNFWMGTK